VNLNFAKYVYGRKRALEVVRRQLGIRHVEMVADNDFGPVFYFRSPEAFRAYHWSVADHARSQGVKIMSLCTVYRDTGAIAHGHPEIRESAYHVGLSILEQGACYGASFVAAALFTMNREEAEDPERFQAGFFSSLDVWKRWMAEAKRLGIRKLLIETAAAYREGCSTIEDTRETLALLDEHHRKNPGTTVPVDVCYDTGHGISVAEDRNDANRDFRAWFEAFPDRIQEVHLKNTGPDFLETLHFGKAGGIIDPALVLEAIRDSLTIPEVLVNIEVPGKRGREIGEKQTIADHVESIRIVHEALQKLGYRQDPKDLGWTCA
jgi:sugar phosphate isomerase/epimerase